MGPFAAGKSGPTTTTTTTTTTTRPSPTVPMMPTMWNWTCTSGSRQGSRGEGVFVRTLAVVVASIPIRHVAFLGKRKTQDARAQWYRCGRSKVLESFVAHVVCLVRAAAPWWHRWRNQVARRSRRVLVLYPHLERSVVGRRASLVRTVLLHRQPHGLFDLALEECVLILNHVAVSLGLVHSWFFEKIRLLSYCTSLSRLLLLL